MSKPVVTTHQTDLQILEIDAWWRAHRDKAPDLFEEELVHHVYYIEREQYVLVVAVWGSVKGSGPDLDGP